MHQLILASQSPRRLELLRKAGFHCTVDTVKVSEIIDKNLNLEAAIERIAWDKAQALVQVRNIPKGQGFLVLAADTVVVAGKQVLGKPKDSTEAEYFLRLLSGVEHRVISGVCVHEIDTSAVWTAHDTTWVQFHPLTDRQIHDYVQSGEPLDRAGAYAIQGAAGAFVKERRGSWSNVVGLPMELFENMVKQHGWRLARN